ncbi:MAG: hypothetical protein ABGY41_07670 [Candidatus Poribacteria bacterium]
MGRVRWLVRGLRLGGALALVLGFVSAAQGEVEKLDLYLYGGISGASKKQIRRNLSPWVAAENISFRQMVRADGSEHPWVTVVSIVPQGKHLDMYDIVRRIKDVRGVNDGRVLWKTDITASGDLRAHYGYSRRSFGWIPSWVQARGRPTSGLWHHMYAGGSGERLVFHENEAYDRLRLASHDGGNVRVRGRIAGFDGPYPVVVLGEFEEVEKVEDSDDAAGAGEQEIPQRTEAEGTVRRAKRPNRR